MRTSSRAMCAPWCSTARSTPISVSIVDATADAPAIEVALTHALQSCTSTRRAARWARIPSASTEISSSSCCTAPLPAPGGGRHDAGDAQETSPPPHCSTSPRPTFTPGYFPAAGGGRGGQRCAAPVGGPGVGGRPERGVARRAAVDDHLQRRRQPSQRGARPRQLARSLAARDPLGGAEAVANYLIACPGWPGSSEPIAHLSPNGVPTPLVIGNVYDPNTPVRHRATARRRRRRPARHLCRLRPHLAAQRVDERLHAATW